MFEWLAILMALVLVHQLRSRFKDLERKTEELSKTVTRLRAELDERARVAPPEFAREPAAPAPVVSPPVAPPVVVPIAPIAPPLAPVSAADRAAARAAAEATAQEAVRASLRAHARTVSATASESIESAGAPSAQPSSHPPTPPRRPSTPPPPPAAPKPPFDWESLIGVKLFSWIAGAALLIAGVLFLRYSIDSGWLTPEIRMAIGFLTGISLLVVCELRVARQYPQTANAMDAAGIGLLFATVFASFALWHLLPALAATVLLMIVTGVAVLLSIRRDSMYIALLGLLGGFATPVMLSTGQDNPVGLFGYLLLLNAGLAWVAYKKRWPLLTALSMVFSTLYQWGWVAKFLTPAKLPIAIGVFLIFPIFTVAALSLGGGGIAGAGAGAKDDDRLLHSPSLFALTARVSAALPLFFSFYLAAIPAYGSHFGILFGFLFCLAAGLFVVGLFNGPRALHTLGGASTVVAFAIWMQTSYTSSAYPAILAFVALFGGFYLVAPRLALWWRDIAFEGVSAFSVFTAPVLLFVFPALLSMEARTAAPALPFGVLFLLLAGCAAVAIAERAGAVHYIAAFFALAAEAVWSSRHLDASQLYPALGLYALFGLFYVGVPFLARRVGRPLQPVVGAGVLTLASLALLLFVAGGPAAESALWGMALLIAVLNVGLYLESATGRMPALTLAGAALSWVILALWWQTAKAAAIVPALVVMGGFAMLTMVGSVWARQRAAGDETAARGFDANVFMGLIGHVFVAFVATRPELSIPPWPIFGALAVLDLACLAVALYLRSGIVHGAATVATALIFMLWLGSGRGAPWPDVGVIAAAASATLAFVALALARRVGAPRRAFEITAGASAILAQLVVLVAQSQPGRPTLYFVLIAQLVLIAAALALSWIDAELLGWFAVAAVVPAGLSGALFQLQHLQTTDWSAQLTLTVPVMLLFTAYPLLLGRRVGEARAPYVSTVLAHVVFFFLARQSLVLGWFGGYMGALPIVQGLLLVPVLAQLVRFERERMARVARDGSLHASARLALVAAATLGCVTLAIPLQLDKNWITIGWALEGAALLWLVRRVRHPGLVVAGVVLLATAFARLTFNPAVLSYHPRGAMKILNWYLYTYLLVAAALFAAARLVRDGDALARRLGALFAAGGALLLFLLLNIEIADFYATGPALTFHFTATLAQDLTYTIGWAIFSLGLLAAGILMRNKPSRIASIALLVATVLKCFLHDLGRLGGLYRVGSFVGLAICLALVAIVLQRFVLARDEPSMRTA
ncbi:MAG TPA: DUF2339 domain-containing protein [Gemmatimonadaceae bacterium]|nr:DUF2339 domain-containing protein [Gemmatimonadaceae bacterium]